MRIPVRALAGSLPALPCELLSEGREPGRRPSLLGWAFAGANPPERFRAADLFPVGSGGSKDDELTDQVATPPRDLALLPGLLRLGGAAARAIERPRRQLGRTLPARSVNRPVLRGLTVSCCHFSFRNAPAEVIHFALQLTGRRRPRAPVAAGGLSERHRSQAGGDGRVRTVSAWAQSPGPAEGILLCSSSARSPLLRMIPKR
jgi:hypothetical protein